MDSCAAEGKLGRANACSMYPDPLLTRLASSQTRPVGRAHAQVLLVHCPYHMAGRQAAAGRRPRLSLAAYTSYTNTSAAPSIVSVSPFGPPALQLTLVYLGYPTCRPLPTLRSHEHFVGAEGRSVSSHRLIHHVEHFSRLARFQRCSSAFHQPK